DLAQQLVDERGLGAEAQRRVHDAVGEAAAVALPAAPTAAQSFDVQDADALDALHRLHRLADDALQLVDELATQGRLARLRREEVRRRVHQGEPFGLHLVVDPRGQRADAARLRLRLGLRDLHALATLGALGVACGEYALLLGHRLRPRLVGGRLRLGLELRLLGDGDGPLLLGKLDGLAPLDLERLDLPLARDALLLYRTLGGDACSIHRLPRLDLRSLGLLILQRLLTRHLGALGRPLHLQLTGLLQAGVFQLAVDVESLALGVEVLVADLDHGVLL